MYTATFHKWETATQQVVDFSYTKQFHSVQDALAWQYKHGQYGVDYMITGVFRNDTGEEVKVWEHTELNDPNIAL